VLLAMLLMQQLQLHLQAACNAKAQMLPLVILMDLNKLPLVVLITMDLRTVVV